MQQSIEVLMLPIAELATTIETQLQENPLLEIDEEKTNLERKKLEEFLDRNFKRMKESTPTPIYDPASPDDDAQEERPIAQAVPLEDYLLEQLHLELSDTMELEIGELIIGNLDENGYFKSSCEDIAYKLGLESAQAVEMVLHMIQNFEPLGIAARDLKECLLIQANHRFNGSAETILRVINNHLEDISKKKYIEIARQLKLTSEKVKEYAQVIAQLEPIPARKYRPLQANTYIRPDITVVKTDDEQYKIQINNEYIPHLRISPFYRKMLNDPMRSSAEKEYIQEKIKNALLFMKSIDQRNQTVRRIAEYIVSHQKPYFEGDHMDLKPLTLKEIADTIGRNESTVSRAINNKYMQTPQGLLPLKYFFSHGIKETTQASPVSNRSLKEEIKFLIEDEDKTKPLSDQDIQNYFASQGVNLARRTVSKYRQNLHILPSHLRKN